MGAGIEVPAAAGRVIARPGAGFRLPEVGMGLIPGLCDHHIHLFGLAARAQSVTLERVDGPGAFAACIGEAAATRPPGAWIRVLGYHERMAGELTRQAWMRPTPRPTPGGMAAAVSRRSAAGLVLGPGERLSPTEALARYLDQLSAPGRRPRRVAPGEPADLCLLAAPLARSWRGLPRMRCAPPGSKAAWFMTHMRENP